MIREFTETVGRFQKGERREYPLSTWQQIAADAKKDLDKMSVEVRVGTISAQPSVRRNTQ